jgi:hypothetical protein
MKTIIFALCLLSAIAAFAADTHPLNAQSRAVSQPPQAQSVTPNRTTDAQTITDDSRDDLCYTMRVYMFEAKEGEAPQLKGMKTCVGENQRILKKAEAPKAQFKPLK